MRLKRIELAGFKSFVDPTRIDLDRGITAIVGPNGCGKSNIVDALRWVLGEHSAKHLRGGVMDDLIFQGSESRPPVAVCDVELTFAVDKGALAPPYHEHNEISIRRRLTREGGSDAFINGKMVRLKDVVDLFLDTGISTRAYAIVEQGSIARMVTAKPEERRVIFEEAAGVMKYRSRRKEASRRMKDTQQNLDRVLDLLEEVRTQCRSLKQQASRAERFKKLQDEYSHLQSLSFALRYRSLKSDFHTIEKQLAGHKKEEADAAGRLASGERSVAEARDKMLAHESEAQTLQDQLRDAERKRADLQQQAERIAGERRLLTERRAALNSRIDEASLQLERVSGEHAEASERLASQDDSELQQIRKLALDDVEKAKLHLQKQGVERDGRLAEFERLRHSSEQARQQQQKAESALARLAEREARLKAQQDELNEKIALQAERETSAASQLTQHEQAYREAESAVEQAQQRLDQARSEREAAAVSLAEHEGRVRELKGTVQELKARTRSQDLPDELREALRSRGALWVDELLHVPEGLEAAVAAALRGGSADARIPAGSDLSQWQSLFADIAGKPVALYAGSGASSVECSLAEAIGLKPDHALYDLFAGVALVDQIEEAVTADYCCVSRDGWRFEPAGWLVPPVGNATANLLAMQRKLRDAEAALATADVALVQASERFSVAEAALEADQKAWQQAHLAVTQSESAWHKGQALLAQIRQESQAQQERSERLADDLNEASEEYRHWQQQLAGIGAVDAAEIDAAKARLNGQNDVVVEAEQAVTRARNTLAQAEQSLALFAQARQNIEREVARLNSDAERLRTQIAADRERLRAAEAELARANAQSDLDRQLNEAAAAVEEKHQQMNAIRQQGHDLQQALHEVEREERQGRQQLQEASQRRQAAELSAAQNQTRLQDLAEEIESRCHISADALLKKVEAMDEELDDADAIIGRTHELGDRLERYGPVNLLAIEEFEQASEREGFLAEQGADLEASLATLQETIGRIDRTTRQRFREVFDQTNALFQKTFPQLFGGGRAELRLDSDDILTAGVEVIAQPPGKRLQDVGLLSGGEKALTAVALVFSIFKIKPAPFCVLDEVDAPLDDANVGRFGEMVRELSDRVQFLAISHNKITMQMADRLVGVSMPEPGVSKIVAVDMGGVPH